MRIQIQGAKEHNLKNINVEFDNQLTVVTGISGSGKTSLVFDTLYHEIRRHYLDVFSSGSFQQRLAPANVDEITGIGPAISIGQNLLNRNPMSTVASASGIHPFLRIFYTNFGERHCSNCGRNSVIFSKDEIIDKISKLVKLFPIEIFAPLVIQALGSHQSLLEFLKKSFGVENINVDGEKWNGGILNFKKRHNIELKIGKIIDTNVSSDIRKVIEKINALGSYSVILRYNKIEEYFSFSDVCSCGTWIKKLEPLHFRNPCRECQGEGCKKCLGTGLISHAASVYWENFNLHQLLSLSIKDALEFFRKTELPNSANRIRFEIERRLEALFEVGLGYISLDRPSPSLSRGESQRLRLAVALTSQLEDILHILDEPTIGQHPFDVAKLIPLFKELGGPVIFIEHDKIAAIAADKVIDLGPGAGKLGGELVFNGDLNDLWQADTPTGQFFSLRKKVSIPQHRSSPEKFIQIYRANFRNLKNIDVTFPIGRMTVVTGVSGSGKTTLVEDVLVASLKEQKPIGCKNIQAPNFNPIMVDQSPIGKNPRSNPATYTKLSGVIRDYFASNSGLTPSHFSFNRKEGACSTCKGMGSLEVKMTFLPSTWITCPDCGKKRFSPEVLATSIDFGGKMLSIAEFYQLSVDEVLNLIKKIKSTSNKITEVKRILEALQDVGLGYLSLGQPSPSLSGGEAQRVKLAKFLSKKNLENNLLVLDEPSTGLHPHDISRFLGVLDKLTRAGATIIVVEHNTDIIRACDWVIDLGPGAGEEGGRLIFEGHVDKLFNVKNSFTGLALKEEAFLSPKKTKPEIKQKKSEQISIRGAKIHNLKNINVDIPKGKITVVTGVSGSGKSSLVKNVIEIEAKRRYLETLSMYERHGVRENSESNVDKISGLGVTVSITSERRLYSRRETVGTFTEIFHHLAILLSLIGERKCSKCNSVMMREKDWICPSCGNNEPLTDPKQFSSRNYSAACLKCHGVGSFQKPNPLKLIRNPEMPLCKGAMYSPGFFPKGYLCKPYNGGYYIIRAIAERYNFDTETTPWNQISVDGQNAFLYGDPNPLLVNYTNRKGQHYSRKLTFQGFYGWIREWDVGGTYTDKEMCIDCAGSGLRQENLAITLNGYNIHQLNNLSLQNLYELLQSISLIDTNNINVSLSFNKILARLLFLKKVGLGYLNLGRITITLSAGEAQRIKLASLLGSNLGSLTIILDEPSRGLHPSEVEGLIDALKQLREDRNTILIVEHDPLFIKNADYILDLGPGAGVAGGQIVASGNLVDISNSDSLTGQWLRNEKQFKFPKTRRKPKKWLVLKGAKGNNLKGEELKIPLNSLIGFCGVSGSGKSTLVIDTLGRILSPLKHTTSVAQEQLDPEEYDSIEGKPKNTVIINQVKKGISNPLTYMGLKKKLIRLYSESDDAKALGFDEKILKEGCSTCKGRGIIIMDMSFLPNVYNTCETCKGSGHLPEVWEIKLNKYTIPELYNLTIDEIYSIFKDEPTLSQPLKTLQKVGLGYLKLRQPVYSLSGGEVQRLKIAKMLTKKASKGTLYILDEPTLGLHMNDISRLLDVLQLIVDQGNTVVIIEHHPYVLASCDWLIELGPTGGSSGGYIIASGTPEDLVNKNTPTSRFVKDVLEEIK